jgi:sugar phosphate isomerase/epimerase
MTKMKTASFRIDREKWDEFIAKAEANGFTGTRVIQDAIDRYIAGTYRL